jgi:hypothetical protein
MVLAGTQLLMRRLNLREIYEKPAAMSLILLQITFPTKDKLRYMQPWTYGKLRNRWQLRAQIGARRSNARCDILRKMA